MYLQDYRAQASPLTEKKLAAGKGDTGTVIRGGQKWLLPAPVTPGLLSDCFPWTERKETLSRQMGELFMSLNVQMADK